PPRFTAPAAVHYGAGDARETLVRRGAARRHGTADVVSGALLATGGGERAGVAAVAGVEGDGGGVCEGMTMSDEIWPDPDLEQQMLADAELVEQRAPEGS